MFGAAACGRNVYAATTIVHFPSDTPLELFPPPTGDSISEGTVAAILKAPGSAVNVDDIVVQIETDKVTIDVRAPSSGTVTDIKVCLSGQ